MRQALSEWVKERLYLSLDTTMGWNCFCIVWVSVVLRGRTIPVAWQVVNQSSSTVRLWTVQRVLRQTQRVLPTGVEVVLLADRGFAFRASNRSVDDHAVWETFCRYDDKLWSYTDCSLLVMAQHLGVFEVVSFDQHIRQMTGLGIVCVP
ncbi:hypothetical protein [Leptolyngbya sp. 7M]|uniref:hypothetical protein n=1 Tax=Leptolyngbya sp. 7M TaxID=2812896 RepID=UPI001B8CBFA7|nr:hypothetical protein [Leptolyngbya sp. 7M]QYO64387.1 hypothetical protein JVX88_32650 [Leptolyngbya sp. 7M]